MQFSRVDSPFSVSFCLVTGGVPTPRLKISVFLVPAVPLVFQQTAAIRAETPLVVKPYCGEMGVDFWDHPKWTAELDIDNTDVLVMTPQIFYTSCPMLTWTLGSSVSLSWTRFIIVENVIRTTR
jgi:hypothetical protein